jgi:hypothetical protein
MTDELQQQLTTKAHPQGWTFVLIDVELARLAGRSHTACAKLDLLDLIAASDGNCLNIWVEAPPSMPLAEAYSIPKRRSFATFSAFRHGKPDLLGFSHNQSETIAYGSPSRKSDRQQTGIV